MLSKEGGILYLMYSPDSDGSYERAIKIDNPYLNTGIIPHASLVAQQNIKS